jgi:hypothetical protein
MAVQNSENISNIPFILSGRGLVEEASTILQDAARTAVLSFGTVMAKVLASGKWVPFEDAAAEDGSAIPQGIYVGGEIAAADIVAGDIEDCPILVGGDVTVDTEQVIIENDLDLDTVIAAAVNSPVRKTVKDWLADKGIFIESTVDIDQHENA